MSYAHKVESGDRPDLKNLSTDRNDGLSHEQALRLTEELATEMTELQDLMFYAGMNGLLLVLQGRDTSGKDGLIRHILNYTNVQSCRVVPFKVPTAEEQSHDFLWRVHKAAPGRGEMVIYNRSHYEDVLVVRVHELVPEKVWRGRYAHINNYEKLLTDSGVIVLKFFLHISDDEQKERLLEREKETEKAWKLSVGDWKERELWPKYVEAYEDALAHCSSKDAPWYIVPADHKWFRNLAVTERIVEALRPYKKTWLEHLEQIGREAKRELETYRAQSAHFPG